MSDYTANICAKNKRTDEIRRRVWAMCGRRVCNTTERVVERVETEWEDHTREGQLVRRTGKIRVWLVGRERDARGKRSGLDRLEWHMGVTYA